MQKVFAKPHSVTECCESVRGSLAVRAKSSQIWWPLDSPPDFCCFGERKPNLESGKLNFQIESDKFDDKHLKWATKIEWIGGESLGEVQSLSDPADEVSSLLDPVDGILSLSNRIQSIESLPFLIGPSQRNLFVLESDPVDEVSLLSNRTESTESPQWGVLTFGASDRDGVWRCWRVWWSFLGLGDSEDAVNIPRSVGRLLFRFASVSKFEMDQFNRVNAKKRLRCMWPKIMADLVGYNFRRLHFSRFKALRKRSLTRLPHEMARNHADATRSAVRPRKQTPAKTLETLGLRAVTGQTTWRQSCDWLAEAGVVIG